MLEAGVLRSGIDHTRQAQLLNAGKALCQWMPYDIVKQSTGNLDESEYRIIDDLAIVQGLGSLGLPCGVRGKYL